MSLPLLITSTIVKEAEMTTVLCTPASAMLILRCMDSDANTFTGVKQLIIVRKVMLSNDAIDDYSWIGWRDHQGARGEGYCPQHHSLWFLEAGGGGSFSPRCHSP